jgi:hypothetical protein
MEVIKTERNGRYLNTIERCNIYEVSKDNLQMKDTNVDTHNPIFEALHMKYIKH